MNLKIAQNIFDDLTFEGKKGIEMMEREMMTSYMSHNIGQIKWYQMKP